MTKVRSDRTSAFINFVFAPPLLNTSGVEERFFEFVHRGLAELLKIDLHDFTALPRPNLGEPFARYRFAGSESAVSLSANSLSVEFPNLVAGELSLILEIVAALDSGFRKEFPDRKFTAIQIVSAEHFAVVDTGGASSYLKRFEIPGAADLKDTVHTPGVRFSLADRHGTWRARCTVESSEALPDGVYFLLDATIQKVPDGDFDARLGLYRQVLQTFLGVLELETEDG